MGPSLRNSRLLGGLFFLGFSWGWGWFWGWGFGGLLDDRLVAIFLVGADGFHDVAIIIFAIFAQGFDVEDLVFVNAHLVEWPMNFVAELNELDRLVLLLLTILALLQGLNGLQVIDIGKNDWIAFLVSDFTEIDLAIGHEDRFVVFGVRAGIEATDSKPDQADDNE